MFQNNVTFHNNHPAVTGCYKINGLLYLYNIYIVFLLGHALEYWQLISLSKDKLFLQKKVQTCPTHNAFLAILCQPARIPQLQHSTLKETMKLLIYSVAKTMHLLNYHYNFFLILFYFCPHDFEIQVFS